MMHHYTLPIFLLLCQVEWSLGSGPLLNGSDELVSTVDETFHLRCEGSEQLYWKVPDPDMDTEYWKFSASHNNGSDRPFVSDLKLEGALKSDTGYFYCFYLAGAGKLETDTKNVDSVYVYFNGCPRNKCQRTCCLRRWKSRKK